MEIEEREREAAQVGEMRDAGASDASRCEHALQQVDGGEDRDQY
jgi:hypothetical protein